MAFDPNLRRIEVRQRTFRVVDDLGPGNRLGSGAGLIQEAGRKAAKRKRPDNLGAYELYLLGPSGSSNPPRTATMMRSDCSGRP